MAQAFHPEAYAAANIGSAELPSYPTCEADSESGTDAGGEDGTTTMTATATDGPSDDTGPEGTDEPGTTPGAGSPGFTPVTAVVALLSVLAAGALRRRL